MSGGGLRERYRLLPEHTAEPESEHVLIPRRVDSLGSAPWTSGSAKQLLDRRVISRLSAAEAKQEAASGIDYQGPA